MCQCCDVSWGADTAESPQPAPRTESASPPARLLAALRGALHLDFTGFWPPAGRSSGPGPWEGSLLAQRASLTPGLAGPGTLGPEDEPPDSQLAGGCGAVQEAMGVCVCGGRGGAPRPSRRGPSGTGVRLGQGPGCAGRGLGPKQAEGAAAGVPVYEAPEAWEGDAPGFDPMPCGHRGEAGEVWVLMGWCGAGEPVST